MLRFSLARRLLPAAAFSLVLALPLHAGKLPKAAMEGNLPEVQRLLDEGSNVNSYWISKSKTALHLAAEQGHLEVVELLLDRGAIVDANGPHGVSPLILATMRGHVDVMRALIQHKARLDATDNVLKWQPLHWAVLLDDIAPASLLLNAGAKPDSKDAYGRTPLHIAAWRGNISLCELLLRHCCAQAPKAFELTMTPKNPSYSGVVPRRSRAAAVVDLLGATVAFNQSIDNILEAPWKKKFPPSAPFRGKTPVEVAKAGSHKDVVRLLSGRLGAPPLLEPARSGDLAAVKLLLEAGADPNARNRGQLWTALHLAVANNHAGIAKCLLSAGANVSAKDRCSGTPLEYAAAKGYVDIMDLLIAHGASPGLARVSGYGPLHTAVFNHHLDAVKFLIAHGAPIEAQSSRGWRPLHWAARYSGTKIVATLLEANAQVNARTSDGLTPLMLAAAAGRADVALLLIKGGADVTSRDNKGHSAYYYGRRHKDKTREQRKAMIKLLKKHGVPR